MRFCFDSLKVLKFAIPQKLLKQGKLSQQKKFQVRTLTWLEPSFYWNGKIFRQFHSKCTPNKVNNVLVDRSFMAHFYITCMHNKISAIKNDNKPQGTYQTGLWLFYSILLNCTNLSWLIKLYTCWRTVCSCFSLRIPGYNDRKQKIPLNAGIVVDFFFHKRNDLVTLV